MTKNCGNCFFWKQKENEKLMGNCLRATKNKKAFTPKIVEPVIEGIAIRFEGTPTITNVLFGINYGCIHFDEKIE